MTTGRLPRSPRPMPEDPRELARVMFRQADRKLEEKLGEPLEEVLRVRRVKRKN